MKKSFKTLGPDWTGLQRVNRMLGLNEIMSHYLTSVLSLDKLRLFFAFELIAYWVIFHTFFVFC